jgi:hypothetical protein
MMPRLGASAFVICAPGSWVYVVAAAAAGDFLFNKRVYQLFITPSTLVAWPGAPGFDIIL